MKGQKIKPDDHEIGVCYEIVDGRAKITLFGRSAIAAAALTLWGNQEKATDEQLQWCLVYPNKYEEAEADD